VSGANSKWIHSSNLTIGSLSAGTMSITAGGTVQDVAGIIGDEASTGGLVTVQGANSVWINSSSLQVGDHGTSTLNISAGGRVVSGNLTVAPGAAINVGAGGTLESTSARLGFTPGGTATVTVSGAGAQWTNSGGLEVGNIEDGTMNIMAGGTVQNANGFVGNTGTNGVVTVDGANSLWTNQALTLGIVGGNGSLNISGGGRVVSGTLVAGSRGTGTITIGAGSTLESTSARLAIGAGSPSANVDVSGANAQWINSGDVAVGESGSTTMNITAGGKVSNHFASIAKLAGSTGTVVVAGAGSTWTISPFLGVGVDPTTGQ
jgi:fibronectin-binding autotransporter adhesin